jgi:hypothetical protein
MNHVMLYFNSLFVTFVWLSSGLPCLKLTNLAHKFKD